MSKKRWRPFWELRGARTSSMLYWLGYEVLFRSYTPFRVFQYSTFRTAMASLTALLLSLVLGPWLIRRLREFARHGFLTFQPLGPIHLGAGAKMRHRFAGTLCEGDAVCCV